MADKSKHNPNDDLVGALESIRGLLEKSETKLSAARESLEKAKSTPFSERTPAKKYKKPPISNEPVVPVLDDVVLEGSPNQDEISFDEDATMMDIPSLGLDDVISTPVGTPSFPAPPSGHTTEEVLEYIDNIESLIDKRVHDALLNKLVEIEIDIKHAIEEELNDIRKMINKK